MNLAVFLDGTWNDPADRTNIDQLRNLVVAVADDGTAQDARYIAGVGTGRWNRIRGGVFGMGLSENIRLAYAWLAERHMGDEDRIFLVGFSRGAFTARSLGGMIAKCGLLPPAEMDAEAVFRRYRRTRSPGLREMREEGVPAVTDEDRLVSERSRQVRIRCIGVFDTVGSLGIPGGLGRLLTRRRYEFHDTNLSGYVDFAHHACAIDEHRPNFKPTMWSCVPIPIPGFPQTVEQRWFVGAHTDVGGRLLGDQRLPELARQWIADGLRASGLALRQPDDPPPEDAWAGTPTDSYKRFLSGLYRYIPWKRRYRRPVRCSLRETLSPWVVKRHVELGYAPENPHLLPWIRAEAAGEITVTRAAPPPLPGA
ncbi:MAG: hypothetical protein QOD86_320 [Miltoncostaeaceae bacterium]|jgi:uncharacterized protein (DUF2235 family)|nr:hypothetical protein [Miltoncostaeaceae bacterium]